MLFAIRSVDKSTCWEPKIAFPMTTPTGMGQLDEHAPGKRINWQLVDSPNTLPTAVPTSPECEIQVQCVCLCVVCFMDPHILYSLVMIRPFTKSITISGLSFKSQYIGKEETDHRVVMCTGIILMISRQNELRRIQISIVYQNCISFGCALLLLKCVICKPMCSEILL